MTTTTPQQIFGRIKWHRGPNGTLTSGAYLVKPLDGRYVTLRLDGTLRDQPYYVGDYARQDEAKLAALTDIDNRVKAAM